MTGRRRRIFLVLVSLTAVLSVGLAGTAYAAATVSRAEVSGDRLRIEGTATANRPITVDGVQMATSSSSGTFKIDRSGYTSPADCTVDVNDGSAAPINVRLSGCTVTAPGPELGQPESGDRGGGGHGLGDGDADRLRPGRRGGGVPDQQQHRCRDRPCHPDGPRRGHLGYDLFSGDQRR